MGKFIELTGQRFGRLTVIERDTSRPKSGGVFWLCKCDCGNATSVRSKDLRRGFTKSCGKHHKGHVTHGLSKTKTHKVWFDMRGRCYNPKKDRYPNYGGRGITVCDEWAGSDGFKAFYDYVSKLEHFGEEGYSLDRIDVNGNYEPGNVRWATDAQQKRNRTDNHYIDINGEKMILADVAQAAGVTKKTIYDRLAKGATPDQLLRKCRINSLLVDVDGKLMTVKEIAAIAGAHKSTIMNRIKKGLTGAALLAPTKK